MKEIFDAADENQDNNINKEEWAKAGMAYQPSEHEDIDFDHYGKETKQVSAVGPMTFDFAALDADKDGRISKDEVASYIDNWVLQVRSTALTLFDAVDRDHDGFLTREEFEKAGQNYDEDNLGGEVVDNSRMVQQLDTDSDGSVCADEAAMRMSPSQRQAFFRYFDINHDGCVTPRELSNAPTFEQLDTDGDGKISLDEAEAFGTQLGVPIERMAKLMAEVDTDGDGSLSKEEFKHAGHIRSGPDVGDTDNLAQEMEQHGAQPQLLQVRHSMLSGHRKGRKRWARRSH
jgi:calcium-binding protein CML